MWCLDENNVSAETRSLVRSVEMTDEITQFFEIFMLLENITDSPSVSFLPLHLSKQRTDKRRKLCPEG